MSDDDKLTVDEEFLKQGVESFVIGFVEGGVDFVEDAQGAGFGAEDSKEQCDCGEGFFSAGEQADGLELFAGRASDNFDSAFERVFGVGEQDVGASATEEFAEEATETFANGVETGYEEFFRFYVDAVDEILELIFALGDIVVLSL